MEKAQIKQKANLIKQEKMDSKKNQYGHQKILILQINLKLNQDIKKVAIL